MADFVLRENNEVTLPKEVIKALDLKTGNRLAYYIFLNRRVAIGKIEEFNEEYLQGLRDHDKEISPYVQDFLTNLKDLI